MKWTMRFAAMVIALVLAFGMADVLRPSATFANDDVEYLGPPPSTKGDPDSGGTTHFTTLGWSGWLGVWLRAPFLRQAPTTRPSAGMSIPMEPRWTITRAFQR